VRCYDVAMQRPAYTGRPKPARISFSIRLLLTIVFVTLSLTLTAILCLLRHIEGDIAFAVQSVSAFIAVVAVNYRYSNPHLALGMPVNALTAWLIVAGIIAPPLVAPYELLQARRLLPSHSLYRPAVQEYIPGSFTKKHGPIVALRYDPLDCELAYRILMEHFKTTLEPSGWAVSPGSESVRWPRMSFTRGSVLFRGPRVDLYLNTRIDHCVNAIVVL
jgi:hypothetical protein